MFHMLYLWIFSSYHIPTMRCTCTSFMFHAYITFITAVLPRKRKPTSTDVLPRMTYTEKQPSDNLEDYSILSPITDEGDESIKTGDSGFEEARQFIRQEVSPEGK